LLFLVFLRNLGQGLDACDDQSDPVQSMRDEALKLIDSPRHTLGQALAIFDHLGAPLWVAKARSELSKTTALTPMDRLTETERRVTAASSGPIATTNITDSGDFSASTGNYRIAEPGTLLTER
jgi:hypothetical protein